jgi:CheY-like chemotaxis protein
MTSSPYENLGLRYLRVANALRKKMQDGVYQPGERLPRQHDLARDHNVAFNTLKQALDLLEREGYVVRKVGQGTYASLPVDHTPTALVVDDDSSIRELLARALASHGWRSVLAPGGDVALQQLRGQRFDLIFLDLVMLGLSGADVFREIRKVDPAANVVIITAYPDSALMAEALQVGPFAMMRKPFSLEELRVVLNHGAPAADPARSAWR